ncbi:MAG: hypothetical protein EOO75_15850 [Myxococcales bacterium]|nr:MAG: hypothetical protein EOO75_15850 [Myxococcales bacterium]
MTATTALRNPAVPLDVLRERLLDREILDGRLAERLAAWHNPSVPLLLLSEPRPEYREGARLLLAHLGTERDPDVSLEVLIEDWRTIDPRRHPRTQVTRDLARHLAGLFSLPWPPDGA